MDKEERKSNKKDYVGIINQIISRLSEGSERMGSVLDTVSKLAEQSDQIGGGERNRHGRYRQAINQRRFKRDVGRLQRIAKDTNHSTQQMALLISALNETLLKPENKEQENATDTQTEAETVEVIQTPDEMVAETVDVIQTPDEMVEDETPEPEVDEKPNDIPIVQGEVIPPEQV